MKRKNLIFICLMIIFAVLGYLFIDRAINIKTKRHINYQINSNIFYDVKLFDNDDFDDNNTNMGDRYITSLVDDIVFTFNYDKTVAQDINGYYNYSVIGNLVAYKDDIKDKVWNRQYTLLDDKVVLLDKTNMRDIKIGDSFKLDYDYYRKILEEFGNTYGVNLSGYMELSFNVNESLEIKDVNDVFNDNTVIKVVVPLSLDTFRVTVLDNPESNMNSYYEFSNRERVNYLFLVIGAFCFSIMIASLYMVISYGVSIYKNEYKYERELKGIKDKYGNILVQVKRFYNKKKYNLIYVDSFNELIDVYNKIKNPITYREIKRNIETIFLITDDDNAWIYRMINENKVK